MKKSTLLKTRVFLCCLPLLIFSACDKDAGEHEPKAEGMIEFNAAVQTVTRSMIDWADFKCAFETGDAIGIFAAPHDTPLAASGNYANNVKLVKQADGGWAYADSEQAIFFPAEGVTLDIYAYYPYADSPVDPTAMAFDAGMDQRPGAPRSDLMTASVSDVSEAGNEISLLFDHVFAMIQLEVSPGAGSTIDMGDISAIDVKLNALQSAVTLHVGTGAATLTGQAGRINMERKSGTYLFRALVPVQPITVGAILFSCTVEAKGKYTQFNYEATPNTALQPGAVRQYHVKLP